MLRGFSQGRVSGTRRSGPLTGSAQHTTLTTSKKETLFARVAYACLPAFHSHSRWTLYSPVHSTILAGAAILTTVFQRKYLSAVDEADRQSPVSGSDAIAATRYCYADSDSATKFFI